MNSQLQKGLLICAIFTSQVFAGFKFGSQSSTLRLSGADAALIQSTPITGFDGTLDIQNKSDDSLQQATVSDTLAFADGILQSGSSNRLYLTGTIEQATGDTIVLDSGQTLEVETGTIGESLEIKGAGNEIKGKPVFSSAIVLENGSAELTLSISNKLSQNVTLNGGKLILGNDLSLQDGVSIESGGGTIDINNKTLNFPNVVSSPLAETLTLENANDVQLNGYTTFNGTWNLTGTGTTRLNGNGNILDMSGGGTIAIPTGHTLFISDVHIKGLGASGGDIDITGTGAVNFSSTTLELSGSYTQDSGTVTFEGDECRVIVYDADQYIVDGATTSMVVDGIVLQYDPLGTAPVTPDPFVEANSGTISLINNGIIRTTFSGGGGVSLIYSLPTLSGDNLLASNYTLDSISTITFTNATPLVPKDMTLDGQGYFIQFTLNSGQHLILEDNITLHIKDAYIKGFDPSLISFGTDSKIVFGDNTIVEIDQDLTFSTQALEFDGNATFSGNNNTITLSAASMLTMDTAGKTSTIRDTRIIVGNNTAIANLNATSTIRLQDSEVYMTATGWLLDEGNLEINNKVTFASGDTAAVGTVPIFDFESGGDWTILSNSALYIDKNTQVIYDPDTTGDATIADEKRHFTLANPSSRLYLEDCIWQTTVTGMALDHGSLFINGKVVLDIDATPEVPGTTEPAVEFGSALQVEISPSGILDIDGALKYVSTTFP